jgi:hypothetical protein
VDHDRADWLAAGDRGSQRGDSELGGHPFGDRVADDPVRKHVLDRAAVELPFDGRVLGDVGQPHRVGPIGGEVALYQVVVHRRPGPLARPALLRRRRPQALLAAQAPDAPLADGVAVGLELVSEEPVAELRVIGVQVDKRVGEMRVGEIPLRARPGAPLVERLGRETEHPAGQPHRNPFGGQVLDQREHHFGSVSLAK